VLCFDAGELESPVKILNLQEKENSVAKHSRFDCFFPSFRKKQQETDEIRAD
jgi:hypothetical protein